jgi:hypothetical protein
VPIHEGKPEGHAVVAAPATSRAGGPSPCGVRGISRVGSFAPLFSVGFGFIDSGRRYAEREDAVQWLMVLSRTRPEVKTVRVVSSDDKPNQGRG